MSTERYEKWMSNVVKYLNELKVIIDSNEKSQNLYNGFYLWDSKLIINPEVMFIGINPGDGNPKNNKSMKFEPEYQMSYLEYLNGENDSYTLARDTVELFQSVGFENNRLKNFLNEKTIKTNFHFIITKNLSTIKECLSYIGKYNEFIKKSFEFIGELIQIIKPKLIIAEGKYSFDMLKEFYTPDEYEYKWENDCGSLIIKNEKFDIIGYSRSHLKHLEVINKPEFAKLLKSYISPR
jgi:hypothetical protein